MERICTCGELKNSTFVVYKDDLDHPDSNIALPFYINNKKFKNKQNKTKAKPQKVTVKFKTGARILKIKTPEDLKHLLNYYPSKNNVYAPSIYNHTDYVKRYGELPTNDLKYALTYSRIEMLKKDYDGIHISDSLAKKYSNGRTQYHNGDYIIFNKDILYSPKEKTQSIRKGTVGSRYKLSEEGLKLSNRTYKFCTAAVLAYSFVRPSIRVLRSSRTGKYRHGLKDVTKDVKRIEAECNRIHRILKLNDVENRFNLRDNASANFGSNKITMGYTGALNDYRFIRTLNAITFNKTALSKVTLEDVTRAVYLHELGHLKNNNRFNDDRRYDQLIDNSTHKIGIKIGSKKVNFYTTTKSAAMKYKKEILLQEKLAWDFAFKYDDSISMQVLSTCCLSTYQSNHNRMKKTNIGVMSIGNMAFRYKNEKKPKYKD